MIDRDPFFDEDDDESDAPAASVPSDEQILRLRDALVSLSDRERLIMTAISGGMRAAQVARIVGLTRQRVGQIYREVIERLRAGYGRPVPPEAPAAKKPQAKPSTPRRFPCASPVPGPLPSFLPSALSSPSLLPLSA